MNPHFSLRLRAPSDACTAARIACTWYTACSVPPREESMKRVALGLCCVFVAAACSKDEVQVRQNENGRTVVMLDDDTPTDVMWSDAWDKVSKGPDKVADAGKWTLERAGDGAIVVGHAIQKVAGGAAQGISAAAGGTHGKGGRGPARPRRATGG